MGRHTFLRCTKRRGVRDGQTHLPKMHERVEHNTVGPAQCFWHEDEEEDAGDDKQAADDEKGDVESQSFYQIACADLRTGHYR